MPAAVDLLRTLRLTADEDAREVAMLAATDPANPYGALLRWPAAGDGTMLTRSVGARVVLVDGALTAYLRRGNANVQVMLPEEEPARSQVSRALAEFLVRQVQRQENPEGRGRTSMLIATVNGVKVREHPLAKFLLDAGFQAAPMGYNVRRNLPVMQAQSFADSNRSS
jgi:ATP-dependent Lhr-like helicase